MEDDNATDGPESDEKRFQRYIAQQRLLQEAQKPRSRAEALVHVRQGLVRAIEGAKFLAAGPAASGLTPDNWHTVRMVLEGLWEAIPRTDGHEAIAALRGLLRAWRKTWGGTPFAGAVERVQHKAQDLAQTLERAKTVGLQAAILEADGKPAAPGSPPSREMVAKYLAIEFGAINEALQVPVLSDVSEFSERVERIYLRMPLGGHGAQHDRENHFRGQVFAEDGEKTVIAAFKALGMPPEKADQLFKANLVKRNRNTKKRLRQERR